MPLLIVSVLVVLLPMPSTFTYGGEIPASCGGFWELSGLPLAMDIVGYGYNRWILLLPTTGKPGYKEVQKSAL